PVAGRLDTGRIAAVGHSAGAYTAAAMFTAGHSPRLRGAVVVAGARPRIDFGGPAAPMLIVHGGADPVVPYATGRATYDRMPWPKAFLTLTRLDHGSYLSPGRRGYAPTMATVTDIQRRRRYLDQRARHRIPADAQRPGVARLTGHL
ncbi:MAG TPA: alpha/beta hydrolase, partial [Asanoa sp.]